MVGMSNVESVNESGVLHRYAEAWVAGEVMTMFGMYSPDVVVHYGGTSEFAGEHRGRDAFVEVLMTTAGRSQRVLLQIEDLFEDGSYGALFTREQLVLDGVVTEVKRALRFRLNDTEILEIWLYDHDQHILDRSWSAPAA
jgi:uncharacterized protein